MPITLYAPSTSDDSIIGRDMVGITARLRGGVQVTAGILACLGQGSAGVLDALETTLAQKVARASESAVQAALVLSRPDVRALVDSAQCLRAYVYSVADLPAGSALYHLRGGQPDLVKGQEALEITICDEPGLVRVPYREAPILIAQLLAELEAAASPVAAAPKRGYDIFSKRLEHPPEG